MHLHINPALCAALKHSETMGSIRDVAPNFSSYSFKLSFHVTKTI